jgi:hypothetical protein
MIKKVTKNFEKGKKYIFYKRGIEKTVYYDYYIYKSYASGCFEFLNPLDTYVTYVSKDGLETNNNFKIFEIPLNFQRLSYDETLNLKTGDKVISLFTDKDRLAKMHGAGILPFCNERENKILTVVKKDNLVSLQGDFSFADTWSVIPEKQHVENNLLVFFKVGSTTTVKNGKQNNDNNTICYACSSSNLKVLDTGNPASSMKVCEDCGE